MRIAELSRRAGVAVPTIKYYLREGLLPAGELTSRNQAQYGEEHLHRLRLVRALTEVGGLSVAAARTALARMDAAGDSVFEAVGEAHYAVGGRAKGTAGGGPEDPSPARRRADAVVAGLGWRVGSSSPARDRLAEVLTALDGLGQHDRLAELLGPYAAAAERVAAAEVAAVRTAGDLASLAEAVVVWTVLGDNLMGALRRLAQEHVSAELLPGGEHRLRPGYRDGRPAGEGPDEGSVADPEDPAGP